MTAHFVHLLDELQRRLLRMAGVVEDMLHEAYDAVHESDELLARHVITRDRHVDTEEVEIEAEVIRLMALYQPVGSDLRQLCATLKINNDLERIADSAVNIAERARHLDVDALGNQEKDLKRMEPIVRRMLRSAVRAFASEDAKIAHQVLTEESAVDALYEQIIRGIVAEASDYPDRMASRLDVLSVAKNLERIADHATNVAEDVLYLISGEIVRHQPPSTARRNAEE